MDTRTQRMGVEMRRFGVALLVCLTFAASVAHSAEKCDYTKALSELNDEFFEKRYDGLIDINMIESPDCPFTGEVTKRVLALAEREVRTHESRSKGEWGEGYDRNLIIALGNTRTVKAAGYLTGYFKSGMADYELKKIGEPAIEYILKEFHAGNVGIRGLMARTLEVMLDKNEPGYYPTPEVKERIKKALIKELKDKRNTPPKENKHEAETASFTRGYLVRTLGRLAEEGDAEVIEVLEKVAKEDPFEIDHSHQKDWTGPQKTYLVRDEAQKVLDRIKGAKPEKPAITNQPAQ